MEPYDDQPTATYDGNISGSKIPVFRPPARWRIKRFVGKGGQADVWLAEDTELREPVVLKVFRRLDDPVARERMRREVRLGRELNHPGLVRIFDLTEMDGRLVAIMEWVRGQSAARLIAREGKLSISRVEEIADRILDVLSYLHGKGVIHRDVKPSNILLDSERRVLLADLGLARWTDGGGDLTRTMAAVGTPAYMAPEQLRGEKVTPAADLFGLGVTLFQLVTGETPFKAQSEFGVADAVLHRRAPRLRSVRPDCPAWLASFIDRLLERSPSDRFPDAAASREAFRRRRRAWSPRMQRSMIAATVVVGLSLGAGAAAVRFLRQPPPVAHVDMIGTTLVARDADGDELWRRSLRLGDGKLAVADVTGSPAPEVILEHDERTGRPRRRVALDILGRGGRRIGMVTLQKGDSLGPLEANADWNFPVLKAGDFDGDGATDFLWAVTHNIWYPSCTGIWRPHADSRPRKLLINSGAIDTVIPVRLGVRAGTEVILSGLNNPLGFQRFVAIISLPGIRYGQGGQSLWSPDLMGDAELYPNSSTRKIFAYVPLGSRLSFARVAKAGPSSVELVYGTTTLQLDRDGNPEGSPAWRRGWQLRQRFWSDLADLCRSLRLAGPDELGPRWTRFVHDHPVILGEPPSMTAAALMAGRAMADGGHPIRGAELLEETATRISGERDLLLRAGEYRLIAGQRQRGARDIYHCIPTRPGGRFPFDQFLLLGLDAVAHGDGQAFQRVVDTASAIVLAGQRNPAGRLRPALLWAEGRFEDPLLQHVTHDRLFPMCAVCTLWAALERGEDPRRVAHAARQLEEDPNVRNMAQLLRAEATLRMGDPTTAQGLAETALQAIERSGRRSYERACWKPVACWVAAETAHTATGSPHLKTWLHEATSTAPQTWYARRATAALHRWFAKRQVRTPPTQPS